MVLVARDRKKPGSRPWDAAQPVPPGVCVQSEAAVRRGAAELVAPPPMILMPCAVTARVSHT